VAGQCILEPQDAALATTAPMLEKDHGRIDWARTARQVHDHVRGMSPWPGAFTSARGKTLKVRATCVVNGTAEGAAPGQVVVADKSRVMVACGQGCVELVTVQPEGKRAITGAEWVMGRGIAEGDVLG
jgi:methionyl-tRNA formyltransferase